MQLSRVKMAWQTALNYMLHGSFIIDLLATLPAWAEVCTSSFHFQ